jgi:cell division protein ZapA
MSTIEIEVAARRYSVACRDGDEDHLRSLAELVDRRAKDAAEALGSLSEARQLLFASLLLADDLRGGVKPPPPAPDPQVAETLELLAERVESLAARLETRTTNP